MHLVIELFATLRQAGARLGPYVLLELLLPGGTLFALLLFLHQRVKVSGGGHASPPVFPPVLVSAAYAAAWGARPARRCAGASDQTLDLPIGPATGSR